MVDARGRRSRTAPSVALQETVMDVRASGVGLDESERSVLQVRKFETDPAFVRVSAGVTKNMGDYESLRVDVAITVPCYVEEIEEVQRRLEPLVATMLDEAVDNYMEA